MQSSVRAPSFALAARFGCQISNPKVHRRHLQRGDHRVLTSRRPSMGGTRQRAEDDDIAPCADTRAALHIPDDHDARIGFQQIARDKLPL